MQRCPDCRRPLRGRPREPKWCGWCETMWYTAELTDAPETPAPLFVTDDPHDPDAGRTDLAGHLARGRAVADE